MAGKRRGPTPGQFRTCHLQIELVSHKIVLHVIASLHPKEVPSRVFHLGLSDQQGTAPILGIANELESVPGHGLHCSIRVVCGHWPPDARVCPGEEPVAKSRGVLRPANRGVGEGAGHKHTQALLHSHHLLYLQ